MIRRSSDAVCDPHRTHRGDKKDRFAGLASKLVVTVCQRFGLKTTVTVSWFGPHIKSRRFGDLGIKIITMVFWFGPQNQVRGGLSVCAT
jgi:hypothetical protein